MFILLITSRENRYEKKSERETLSHSSSEKE